ncbi:hypothetical protein MBLNU13_g07212t2 [Cladosporium sp. NU13]
MSDTDDSPSVADYQRETKATGGQRRKPTDTQRSSKKPAPRPRHNTTNADIDDNASDDETDNNVEENDNPGDNDDEENDNPGTNDEQANAREANDEEDEEKTYKELETDLLKAKMQLLLVEKMKKKTRQEFREQLAEEMEEAEEPTGGEKQGKPGRKKSGKSSPSKKSKSDFSKRLWAIHGIIKESTYHYLVVWRGEGEDGQPWDDWWVAKRDVNAAAKRDWAALRASEAKDRMKKREKCEKAKAKAQKHASCKGQGGGQGQDLMKRRRMTMKTRMPMSK